MERVECTTCGTPMPVVRIPSWRQVLWGGWTCSHCGSEFDRWGRKIGAAGVARRTQTLDDSTAASNPGGLSVSEAKMRGLRPDVYTAGHLWREKLGLAFPLSVYLAEHLQNGDSRAAVVVSVRPLRIAAYTDDIDCVALLAYPDDFATAYGLRDGSRLLTVNTFSRDDEYAPDLVPGPKRGEGWTNFHPIIAEFVSDDDDRIEARKRELSEAEWKRAYRMGKDSLARFPGRARDGRPVYAAIPAKEGDA